METISSRAGEGRRLILAGVIVNIILSLAKVLGGTFGHSQALIADGIESSLDILSSAMLWVAMKYAERPADHDHPYGHGKIESLAATVASMLVIGAGLAVAVHSASEIISPHAGAETPAGYTLIILGVTIAAKEFLFRWFSYRGKMIGSTSLQTDAIHHRSDAMTSLAAAIGIIAALAGGPGWAPADDWAALFSCFIIVANGFRMLRGSLGDILDEQASPKTLRMIRKLIHEVPGVTSVEKCRARKSGLSLIADLHVRVRADKSVREGHDIAHRVKDRLMDEKSLRLSDVTVHIEPEED